MIKYIKTLWENTITPVNGKNMNKIEDALEYLYDIIRNVPNEENVRIANEKQRQSNETTRYNDEIKRNANFDNKIKDVDKAINASNENIKQVNNKFESISASKQQDAEIIIARDGEISLNTRLDRDLKKGKLVEETKEGTYLSFNDTVGGLVSYLEVQGNTVQDVSRLQDIKSVGIDNGDGTYKMSILSCGENLFDEDSMEQGKTYYIKLPIGQFTFSAIATSTTNARVGIFILNEDNSALSSKVFTSKITTSITFTNAKNQIVGLKIGGWDGGATLQSIRDIKLQEGTVATPYTPYEETRCDIKLPCQLEKVGDIADRLYFDKEENAWCVDKNIVDYIINGSENWNSLNITPNVRCWFTPKILGVWGGTIINSFSANINTSYASGDNHIGVDSNKNIVLGVDLIKSKDVPTFKNYLSENNIVIKYSANVPQKIVLPKSEQIKLNSFANKTHIYTISGEVDATVKVTVSKSLTSTVQANINEINNLNDRVSDIEGLKESQDFEYETDKGYLACKDTKNGVVKDLKLYGKSLVNIAPKIINRITLNKDKRISDIKLNKVVPANTEFTVGINVAGKKAPLKGLLISFHCTDGTFIYDTLTTGVYSQFKVFKLNKEIESISLYLHLDELASDNTAYITFDSLLVCEGVINEYFEGIVSVRNDNGIEVSSVKGNGNLFNKLDKPFSVSVKKWSLIDDKFISKSENPYDTSAYYYIKVEPNINYTITCESTNCGVLIYDGKINTHIQDNHIASLKTDVYEKVITTKSNYITIRLSSETTLGDVFINKLQIVRGNQAKPYEQYKSDKKLILFKDVDGNWKPVTELRGIDLTTCDTIEEHSDGKHYLHVRVIENKLKDLPMKITGTQVEGYFTRYFDLPSSKIYTEVLCTHLPFNRSLDYNTYKGNVIFTLNHTTGRVAIRVSNSIATDDTSLLKWLTDNNVTILTQLAQEQVYEVNPLDLESYENETMISIDNGVVSPYASWKITSYLPNFVRNLSSQVRQLQDQVYKTNVANFTVALNTLDTKLRLNKLEAPKD